MAAVLLDFENYTAGSDVVGQPSSGTKWGGNTGIFFARSGVGNTGKAIVSTSGSSTGSPTYYPTDTDMGATWSNTAKPTVAFSFDMDLTKSQGGTAKTALFRMYIGLNSSSTSTFGIGLIINANGAVNTSANSNTALPNVNVNDQKFHAISGTLNYNTNTYTLLIDGVTKLNNQAFDGPPGATAFTTWGGFRPNVITPDRTNNEIVFDNLAMSVPEPTSIAAFSICVVGLTRRLRTRSA